MIESLKAKWAEMPVKWKIAAGVVVAIIIVSIIK